MRPPAPTTSVAGTASTPYRPKSTVPCGKPVSRLSSRVSLSAVLKTTSADSPAWFMRQASAPGRAGLARSNCGSPRENSLFDWRSRLSAAMVRYSGAWVS